MADIPFLILMGVIFPFIVAILALGYIYRTSFPMSAFWFMSGAVLLLLFIISDTITIGYTDAYSIVNPSQILFTETMPASDATITSALRASQILTNAETNMFNTGTTINGELITSTGALIGDEIDTIQFKLKKSGSPTGTISVGIDNDADPSNDIDVLFNTKDSTTLTTTSTFYNFTKSGADHTIATNDRIIIHYNGGDAVNFVAHAVQTTDVYDSTNSIRTSWSVGTTYVNTTTHDITFRLYDTDTIVETPEIKTYNYNGENTIVDYEAEPINYAIKEVDENGEYTLEPTFVGIMLIIFAIAFIMVGVLIEKYN